MASESVVSVVADEASTSRPTALFNVLSGVINGDPSALAEESSDDVSKKFSVYNWENIAFSDVVARSNHSLAVLDHVVDLLKDSSAAEDVYSQALIKSISSVSHISHTGQGLSSRVDAVAPKGGVVDAGIHALGFGGLFGSSSKNEKSVSNEMQLVSVGNGLPTVLASLGAVTRATSTRAAAHAAVAARLRGQCLRLTNLRSRHSEKQTLLIGRATETINLFTQAARDLEKAQQRVHKARNELQAAEARVSLLSAPPSLGQSSGIAGTRSASERAELLRRQGQLVSAQEESRSSQELLFARSEEVVSIRKKRDAELAAVAASLQQLELERLRTLGLVLEDLRTSANEAVTQGGLYVSALEEALLSLSPLSDVRGFTAQRRLASLLLETSALLDARVQRAASDLVSGEGNDGNNPFGSIMSTSSANANLANSGVASNKNTDEGLSRLAGSMLTSLQGSLFNKEDRVIPETQPASTSLRYSKEFLQAEAQLTPVVERWVRAIFTGTGRDVLDGEVLDYSRLGISGGEISESIVTKVRNSQHDDDEGDDEAVKKTAGSDNESPTETPASVASVSISSEKEETPNRVKVEENEENEEFNVSMLSNHAARIVFLRCLSLHRGTAQDCSGGIVFTRLLSALWLLLDACLADEDVCCARLVTVISETYFRYASEEGNEASSDPSLKKPRKIFLQHYIRRHRLWLVESFWEEVFYDSVYNAVKVFSSPYGTLGGLSQVNSIADGNSTESVDSNSSSNVIMPTARPGTADWNQSYIQTLFSQLAATSMHMLTFGIPLPKVTRFVGSLARSNGLPIEMLENLKSTLKAYH